MSKLAEKYLKKYFGNDEHPYRTFENLFARYLNESTTLLDAGCGYTAPVLQKYCGRTRRAIGIDLVDFTQSIPGVELYKRDLSDTGLEDNTVDIIIARSVIEHIADPGAVFREFARILKPGGRIIFLTANLFDYASIIARIIPNRFHPWIVSRTEGREEADVFPIQYKINTRRAVDRHAKNARLAVASFSYLGQYPGYFMFNGALFLIATAYEKLISRFGFLHFLRGWILVELRKGPSPD